MDIEKLIERLRTDSLYKDKATLEIMDLCIEAADALSTLQAENERLKNKLSELAHFPFDEPGIGERTRLMAENAELRAELEQVKRERDAAVSDLTFVVNQYRLETTGIDLCGLCEYDLPPVGENGQTAECPGFYVNDCFKWRGPEEG